MKLVAAQHHLIGLWWIVLAVSGQTVGQVVMEERSLLQAEQAALQQAVAKVAPAVVQIETFGGLERVDEQVVAEGPTTGTILDEDGWIITSLYALRQQPASILVTLSDGSRLPAKVAARDHSRELALLKIEPSQPLTVAVASNPVELEVGQWCVAVGKTYDPINVTQSVGIISALGRAYGRAVQTDAKVSPINYGGPLVDIHGQVIGILAPVAAGEMLADDGSVLYDSGIGFAVPLVDIRRRLPQLQQGQDVRIGRRESAESQNELAGPVRLTGATPGSPAARAGAVPGDIIVEAQGQTIELLADLRHALAQVDAGETFEFVVERDGQRHRLSCTLRAEIPVYRRRYLGISVEPTDEGLKIVHVSRDSPADRIGLKIGQVLTRCNDQPLTSRDDLAQLLAVADLEIPLRLDYQAATNQPIQQLSVRAEAWPTQLPDFDFPKHSDRSAANPPAAGTAPQWIDLKLADIPNKVQAILPADAAGRMLGLLVLYPEPGELDAERFRATWNQLASDHGWMIVIPTSTDPQAWSRDETELASRLLARLDQQYRIDRSRTVVGGIGVGGQLAILAGLTESQRISGIFTVATRLRPFTPRQPSMPLQTLDFLFVADSPPEPLLDQLTRLGYVAHFLAAPGMDVGKPSTIPLPSISRWLESLGQL